MHKHNRYVPHMNVYQEHIQYIVCIICKFESSIRHKHEQYVPIHAIAGGGRFWSRDFVNTQNRPKTITSYGILGKSQPLHLPAVLTRWAVGKPIVITNGVIYPPNKWPQNKWVFSQVISPPGSVEELLYNPTEKTILTLPPTQTIPSHPIP